MVAVHGESRWLPAFGTLVRLTGSEVRAASKQTASWIVLGLGLGNLLAGLVGASDWLPTFAVLDIVYANLAGALWIVAVHLGGQPPLARFGRGIAAKVFALAGVVAAMLTAAGAVAIAVQLWRSTMPPDMPLYTAGLYANLGASTLHLALLAVALRAILGRRWLATGATAVVWIGTNLGFDHPLLRFGTPINPASGMSGFGPFVAPGIALGLHWTGCCLVLIAVGWRMAGRRTAGTGGTADRPWEPNIAAAVWTAGVAWIVSGGWILANANLGEPVEAVGNNPPATPQGPPQPDYSRLDIAIQISPLERILLSRGSAIAVNRREVPIPELHFGIPRSVDVVALHTTGALVGIDGTTGCRRYRLNRPLEPKETLKIEFDLRWTADGFPDPGEPPRLLGNGTFASTADVVPGLGCANGPHPFRSAPPVAYRAQLGTSLDQVAVTAGTLVRAWKENGWSFFEYETEAPIPPFTTIHSGHYAIQSAARAGTLVEVFHHPQHGGNVERMIAAAHAALAHRSAPRAGQRRIRVVEVPDYRPFRRLGLLGLGLVPPPAASGFGRVLPYSERGYPLNTPPPTGSTPPHASDRTPC